jgi:hypothetical protein
MRGKTAPFSPAWPASDPQHRPGHGLDDNRDAYNRFALPPPVPAPVLLR